MKAVRLATLAAAATALAGCVPVRYADCGGGTVRLADDPDHCGGCHAACPVGAPCVEEQCVVPDGATSCADEAPTADAAPRWRTPEEATCGAGSPPFDHERGPVRCRLANPRNDPAHCGACGNACPPDASCVDGGCTCEPGRTRCLVPRTDDAGSSHGSADAPPDLQLEPWRWDDPGTLAGPVVRACVEAATDPAHCGSCNRRCPTGASCAEGECVCGGGRTFCPRETTPWEALDPPDAAGVCLDLATSQASCGACGSSCASDERCVDGGCVPCCESPP